MPDINIRKMSGNEKMLPDYGTIDTLRKYAAAVGKRLEVRLV
ncbi:MAG: hypothetical protein ACXWT1_02420 [Methylobacter sp.]